MEYLLRKTLNKARIVAINTFNKRYFYRKRAARQGRCKRCAECCRGCPLLKGKDCMAYKDSPCNRKPFPRDNLDLWSRNVKGRCGYHWK